MSSRGLIIFGSGGHAISVASVANSMGYDVKFFVDSTSNSTSLLGIPIVKEFTLLGDLMEFSCALGIGDNHIRRGLVRYLATNFPRLDFPQLVHSSAIISAGCRVGSGSVVMPGVVVGPMSKIGRYCILNTNSSIDHESEMEDFSSLAPGVSTGGKVSIGTGSAICIGAKIKHGINIGRDTVVGANSYVSNNIPALQVVYGSPARFVRQREMGDPYLN